MKKIEKIPLEFLKNIIQESFSWHEVLRKIDYKNRTTGLKKLKYIIETNNFSTEHFRKINNKKDSLNEYLIKDFFLHSRIRKRIVHEILKPICSNCHIGEIWNNKHLTLHLDHIDGNVFNNEINNLRVLCPNCHSQTDTFGSKNRSKKQNNTAYFCICKKNKCIPGKNTCFPCLKGEKRNKLNDRVDNFLYLLGHETLGNIAKKAQVSTKFLRKRLKELKITSTKIK